MKVQTIRPFSRMEANLYDTVYSTKDYEAESRYVASVIRRFGTGPARRILDLSCGTGQHASRLSRMGFTVLGIDRSKEMLEVAKRNFRGLEFREGDFKYFRTRLQFDACVSLFDSVNYTLDLAELEGAFHNIRRLTRSGGLFVFQFLNGLAAFRKGFGKRRRLVAPKVTRETLPEFNPINQVCKVRFIYTFRNKDVRRYQALHEIRVHNPAELSYLLLRSGFGAPKFLNFLEGRSLHANDWHGLCVTRAVRRFAGSHDTTVPSAGRNAWPPGIAQV